jgi:dolichol-phosphate mannosyltransferase
VKAIKLSRRGSQHSAIIAGLAESDSHHYLIMDGDLQDSPEDIPQLYRKALEGFDVVCGVKSRKNDRLLRNFCSRAFNSMMNKLSDVEIDSNTSMFRIITQRTAKEILRYNEPKPSLNLIISTINLPTAYIPVTSNERYSGKTNYSFLRLVNLSVDWVLSFSTKPLRILSKLGLFMSFASFIAVILTVIHSLVVDTAPLGWPTLISAIFMLSGIQIFALGVIGEYVGRTFIQSKNRPLYTIEERIGFE